MKRILLTANEDDEPPSGLVETGYFRRRGILNPAVIQEEENRITLLSRLVYEDSYGLNSCIVRNQANLEEDCVRIIRDESGKPLEELAFQSESPHGQRGVEDFRVNQLEGESPLHGFLVHYDGFNERTEYVRTLEKDPTNLLSWEKFGIYFPNITTEEAIELVPDERYKRKWGRKLIDKINYNNSTRNPIPENPFLWLKDCCSLHQKVKRADGNGNIREYYAVITRFFPDIQIVYIRGFEELAKHEFWQQVIKNLNSYFLLGCEYDWEQSHIGLAGPPFELDQGTAIPYHGAVMEPERDYKFGIALVDKRNPQKILARSKKPLLFATEPWEMNGLVPGKVVFPTGQARIDDKFFFFYGAADNCIAYTIRTEQQLLDSLD